MAYLDPYNLSLTPKTAAHLLRRATFGPTQQEIKALVGKTPSEAVDMLINNSSFTLSPPPPVEMQESRSDYGQTFLDKPYTNRNFAYYSYIKYWWIGLMAQQNGKPSVLEKLTAFWQNHFVTTYASFEDYRAVDKYLRLLRNGALGSYRDMVIRISKDPAMLYFQNGNENTKGQPNENYARELQELFTVGQKNFSGKQNYTEDDVKAAARVLTGWQVKTLAGTGSDSLGSVFTAARHDTSDKIFSSYYNSTTIIGRSGDSAGDQELGDLVDMLLRHPETPKFICRKLYRWYVNPNVTQEIEDQVIVPLADFFKSSGNNYAIAPVLAKLLKSHIFFDNRNIGAIVKSPSELMIGTLRFFDQPVPDITTEPAAFRTLMTFLANSMDGMQLNLLNQPSVFGSIPYFQTGYSMNWINETSLGLRGSGTDTFVYPTLTIKPGYILGIDVLGRLSAIQPNFSDVTGTPAITCEDVLAELSKNMFATDLDQAQKDFLIDSIMMMNSSGRTTWIREWDALRADPTNGNKKATINWRCRALLKYMLRMAEYQLF
ncbi:DUF1800 domain-containing protein [Dyadobacter crusticola]|uniref:DUF1800 domain-containing protein n=1 Tax=Dyadobacter crusticola TaxID=292407 RepID=UPI0004E0C9AC|nr:DUF1800 domain-containing protein [Dyadobacter crusticola]